MAPSGQNPPARPLLWCAGVSIAALSHRVQSREVLQITGSTSRTHTAKGAFSYRINKARSFKITPLTTTPPSSLLQPQTGPFQASVSLLEVIGKILLSTCYLEVSRSPPHSFKNALTSYTPTSLEFGYSRHSTIQAMLCALRSPAGR